MKNICGDFRKYNYIQNDAFVTNDVVYKDLKRKHVSLFIWGSREQKRKVK